MEFKPIKTKTKAKYKAVLREIEALFDAPDRTPETDMLEVLNRARPLLLAMVRRLSEGLKLPADVLIVDYELRHAARKIAPLLW